jgi:hypothetical protein
VHTPDRSGDLRHTRIYNDTFDELAYARARSFIFSALLDVYHDAADEKPARRREMQKDVRRHLRQLEIPRSTPIPLRKEEGGR